MSFKTFLCLILYPRLVKQSDIFRRMMFMFVELFRSDLCLALAFTLEMVTFKLVCSVSFLTLFSMLAKRYSCAN